jgi:hypothetical protein
LAATIATELTLTPSQISARSASVANGTTPIRG